MPNSYTRPAQVLDALDRGPLPEDVPRIRAWVVAAKGHEDLGATLDSVAESRMKLVEELAEVRPVIAAAAAALKVHADAEAARVKLEADRVAGRNLWRHPRTLNAVGGIIIAILSLLLGRQLPSMPAPTSSPSAPVGVQEGAP